MIRQKSVLATCAVLGVVMLGGDNCSAQAIYGRSTYGMGYSYPGYGSAYPYYVPPNYFGLPPMNLSTLGYYPTARTTALPLSTSASIEVKVPSAAQVWFDDDSTRQAGTERLFGTPDLQPGRRYSYRVRASWTDDGKSVTQTRTVYFRAGEYVTVDFLNPQG